MHDNPLKIFVAPRRGDGPTIRLLDPAQHTAFKNTSRLFKSLPSDFSIKSCSVVKAVEQAEAIVIPQAMRKLDRPCREYLQGINDLAARVGVPAILFIAGDGAHGVHVPFSHIFIYKGSAYGKSIRDNERVFAPFVEDLGQAHGLQVREKQHRPVVSFCGYANFVSTRSMIRSTVEKLWLTSMGVPERQRGIFIRRRALNILERDVRFETKFISRNFFTGDTQRQVNNPNDLRSEYVQNMRESDFVLAPKGDGNYSNRFFEALSLGRIPILVDTDMVLPSAHIIPYDRFVVRVPYADLANISEYVLTWWNALSNQEYEVRQHEARRVFSEHLRYDAYFNDDLPKWRSKIKL